MNLSYLKFHIGWYRSDLVLPICRGWYWVGRWQCTVPRQGAGVERGDGTFCIEYRWDGQVGDVGDVWELFTVLYAVCPVSKRKREMEK